MKLTLQELFKYLEDGSYWKLDDLKIPYKKKLSVEEIEAKKEKDAYLKDLYYKKRKE